MSENLSVGIAGVSDWTSDYQQQSFLISSLVSKVDTAILCKVIATTSKGHVANAPTVDVVVLAHMLDGNQEAVEHTTLYNIPIFRLAGGHSAIIIDPNPDDIGLLIACSRDITTVKKTRKAAKPPTLRQYSYSDSIYLGQVLHKAPNQYIIFNDDGIEIHTPKKFKVSAKAIEMRSDTTLIKSDITTKGGLTSNGHDNSNTHRHKDSGGDGDGGVVI